MSPPSWIENFFCPELQTDDCFATGVTRQTLLKPKENVHTGEGLRRPSSGPTPSALRRFAPRSGPSVPPSSCPPLQKSCSGYAPDCYWLPVHSIYTYFRTSVYYLLLINYCNAVNVNSCSLTTVNEFSQKHVTAI